MKSVSHGDGYQTMSLSLAGDAPGPDLASMFNLSRGPELYQILYLDHSLVY